MIHSVFSTILCITFLVRFFYMNRCIYLDSVNSPKEPKVSHPIVVVNSKNFVKLTTESYVNGSVICDVIDNPTCRPLVCSIRCLKLSPCAAFNVRKNTNRGCVCELLSTIIVTPSKIQPEIGASCWGIKWLCRMAWSNRPTCTSCCLQLNFKKWLRSSPHTSAGHTPAVTTEYLPN